MKVIIHVGAGKTGTSSIQKTLGLNRSELNRQGIEYAGLMFEYMVQKYDWQRASASEVFHSLAPKEAALQVLDIIETNIPTLESQKIHTLIWSNESLFERNEKVILIAEELLARNIEVEIIAYIRNYDSWSQSAYKQWGIKHKTYEGPIRSFKNWFAGRHVHFYGPLDRFRNKFPNLLKLKNMDSEKDVVPGFLKLCGITTETVQVIKANESPSNEELFLRALFNNGVRGKALPNLFENMVLSRKKNLNTDPSSYLEKLMPKSSDMEMVIADSAADKEALDELLTQYGEEATATCHPNVKSAEVDQGKLITLLSQIVVEQSRRIHNLEKKQNES